MSTTVDQRVVEMRFDNRDFEKNVATSMSTLEKLKQRLDLKGASKGLEDINSAAKKVDMNGLGRAVETVSLKFSAMQVMGVTALANITNSAINAGKQLVKSLTIDPVKTGFSEYETKINSIQTIMSNTASKGTTMEDVTRVIDELNTYADKTIYNFAEMTRNIGTFTAAGVGLEESAAAIKGIANLAAASGSTSQQASTAMYQLSQALAAGTVKLMDWNSVVNAGMGGEKFQEALKATAREHGIAVDKIIKKNGSFRESLSEGWISAEILNETLNKFTVEGATAYANSMKESGKWTEEQAQALIKEAKAMEDAATKVKTFTQLMDTMKESVQSGWGKTWELVFGNFEEAKEFFSGISNSVGKVIDTISDSRNNLLEDTLSSNWDKLNKKITAAGLSTDEFSKKIKTLAKDDGIKVEELIEEYGSLGKVIQSGKIPINIVNKAFKSLLSTENDVKTSTKELEKVADRVLNGEFGRGKARIEALTKAGYDYATVQNIINERLGSSTRHTSKLTEEQLKNAGSLVKMSDEQLKSKGYTEEQITALRELQEAAEKGGTSINEIIKGLDKMSGRQLLLESLTNIFKAMWKPLEAIGKAWGKVFSIDSDGMYGLLEAIHGFTEELIISDQAAENFQKIFEGIFSIVKTFSWVINTSLVSSIKLLKAVLGLFDMDMADLIAKIGDWVTKIRTYIDEHIFLANTIDEAAKIIEAVVNGIKDCYNAFMSLEPVKKLIKTITELLEGFFGELSKGLESINITSLSKAISDAFAKIGNLISSLKNSKTFAEAISIGENVIAGLVEGLSGGITTLAGWAKTIATTVIDVVKAVFDINSPSKVFFAIGGFVIAGLISGIMSVDAELVATLNGIATKVINWGVEVVKNFGWGIASALLWLGSAIFPQSTIMAISAAVTGIIAIFTDGVQTIEAAGKDSATKYVDGFQNGMATLWDKIKAVFQKIVDGITSFDWSKILAGAMAIGVVLFAKKLLDVLDTFSSGVSAFGEGINKIGNLADAFAKKINPKKNKFREAARAILEIAIAMGILAASVYVLAQCDWKQLLIAVGALAALAVIMFVFAKASEKINVGNGENGFGKLALSLVGIAAALYIMASAIKKISFLTTENVGPILAAVVAMIGGLAGILWALGTFVKGKTAQNIDKAGITILKISTAMLLLTFVIKQVSKLDAGAVIGGGIAITAFAGLVTGLLAATRLAGKKIDSVGPTLIKISIAMLLLVGVIKAVSKLDPARVVGGVLCIGLFELLIAGLLAATKLAGPGVNKFASTVLSVSAAILLLGITARILGELSLAELAKGIIAVTALGGIITGLIAATNLAGSGLKGVGVTLLSASFAIGVLAAIAVMLSLISIEGLAKGIVAVGMLSGMMVLLIRSTKDLGTTEHLGKAITSMAVAIGIMAASLIALSFVKLEKLVPATIALSIVMGMFALIAKCAGTMGKVMGSLIIMTVAVGLMAGMLAVLVNIPNSENVLPVAASLSAVMIALSAALKVVSTVGGTITNALKGIAALVAMVVPLAVFATAIYYMPDLTGKEASIVTLTTVMTAMTALMLAVTAVGMLMGTGGSNALKGIIGLTAMVVPLVAFGASLALIGMMSSHISAAISVIPPLTILMTTMTALLLALSGIGVIIGATGGTALLGIVGLTAMAVPLIAFGGSLALIGLMSGPISKASPVMEMLTSLMATMTKTLIAASIVGLLAPAAVTGLTTLAGVMLAFGGLAAGIGVLLKWFPQIEEFVSVGIPILEKLAQGLGAVIGNFVSGLLTGALSGLPEIGTLLSQFMNNANDFVTGIKMVDESVMTGVKTLGAALAVFLVADWINNITSFDGTSFSQLGTELSAFMINAMPFIIGMSAIKPEIMTSVKALAEALLLLTASDLLNNLLPWQDNDALLSNFASQLVPFGEAIVEFSGIVSEIDTSCVAVAAQAGKDLADMCATIQGSGGLQQRIFGEKDLGVFAVDIELFGAAIAGFAGTVAPKAESIKTAAGVAAYVGKIMTDLQSNIQPIGGWVDVVFGSTDLDDFGITIKKFGIAIVGFAGIIGSRGEEIKNACQAAADAGTIMTTLQNNITPIGGIMDLFTGSTDLDDFGYQLTSFGKAIVDFSEEVSLIDTEAVNTAATVGQTMAALANNLPESGGFASMFTANDDLSTFGSELKTFGSYIAGYSEEVANVNTDAINGSLDAVKNIVSTINNLGAINTQSVDSLQSALDKLSKVNVDGFVNAFKSASSQMTSVGTDMINSIAKGLKTGTSPLTSAASTITTKIAKSITDKTNAFKNAGVKLMDSLMKGISSQNGKVKTAVGKVVSAGVTKAREYYDNFQSAGEYVVSGFADGIDENTFKAEAKAAAMAKAALEAAEEALGVQSPSKEFRRVGMFTVLGLVRGLQQYTHNATSASRGLANDVNDSFREELGIHSPSLVMNENGQYIVEGLAEGIDKDTTAEEAMKRKADNVASAFNTEINKHDLDVNTAKLEYDLWSAENADASEFEKLAREAEYLNIAIAEQESVVALANREQEYMNELLAEGAVNAQQAQEAYNKWITESKDLVDLRNTLDGVNESMSKIGAFDPTAEMAKHADKIKTIDLEHELWNESLYGTNADKARLAAANIEKLSRTLTEQYSNVTIAQKAWNDTIADSTKTPEEAKAAYDTLMQAMTDYAKTSNELTQAQESEAERQKVAKKAFDKYMREHLFLVEQGISREEIEKTASKITGHSIVPITSTVTEDIAKLTAQVWGEEYPEALSDAADKVDVPDSIAPDEYDLEESRKAYLGLAEVPVDEVRGLHDDYEEAGEYLVEGFVDGIYSGLPAVEKASAKVGTTAITANMQSIDAHSPSREFFKIGGYAIQGFVNAFGKGVRRVYDASTEIGDTAKNGLRDAISKITAVINSDLDMQPTIRPVLDLSDVSANAGRIGDMLAFAPSIGTMSNLRAINSMMANYSQNGGNDDVVSEIKKLRKGLDNVGGNTTYNVNGVTYDDGSNIATTVKDLVRAAKIERRI